MSDLTQFRDHARFMAATDHLPTCAKVIPGARFSWDVRTVRPDPACNGCITPAEQELWSRLADEVDAYFGGDAEEDLFGEMSVPQAALKVQEA